MEILVLGGDGYLGWPTAMHLSSLGHDVTVVDNYFRRHACENLDVGMLYALPTLVKRAQTWKEVSGKEIKVIIADCSEPTAMRAIFEGNSNFQYGVARRKTYKPAAVIHYAEQPSAPYSIATHLQSDFTIVNNLRVTNNLIWCVKEYSPETHIVKLGTMGEYGTPNIDIEEGWINVEHKGRSDKFLFPRQAGSIYHTTKVMDTDLIWWAVRIWGLRVTDLMQGPVYGLATNQTVLHDDLRTLFNYDEVFGTIVNRFVVQSVAGYPLTIYGKGGQTRGYLNIRDTLQCVEKTINTPAEDGQLRIFNQITETLSVNEIATLVKNVGDKLGYSVSIENVENPRKESEEHYYNPTYQGLKNIGVEPTFLTDSVLTEMFQLVEKYKQNIRKDVIYKGIKWV